MATHKRKTGGRTTPKGTPPGGDHLMHNPAHLHNPEENHEGVHASRRYTPPITKEMRESPPWIPALMLALFVLGGVLIIMRNLVFAGNNWLTLLGLACVMGGLFTATKWR